jgi:glycine cleavage system aminomethyltransferase T
MPASAPPIAQSPLTDLHRRHGAAMQLRDGWMVATRYPDEPAAGENAIVDLAHWPTWEINGPDVSRKLAELCEYDVLVRKIHVGGDWQVYRLTARRAIVFGKTSSAIAGALDVTGGWVTLALIGPDAEQILNKVTAVDLRERTLPMLGCCQGPIFGVNTLFGRFTDHFELHICGDSAEFLWEVLLDAGGEFGLKPAGADIAVQRGA